MIRKICALLALLSLVLVDAGALAVPRGQQPTASVFAAGATSFDAAVAAGDPIATLGAPFPGSTCETVGAPPGQLALSGCSVVAGSTQPASGTSYSIKIRAISPDGAREVAETFPFRAAGGAVIADFARGIYVGGTFSDFFALTRASVKTDLLISSPSGYVYTTFASGQPAITPGRGLLIEESRTNYLLNSATPATQTVTLSNGSYPLWVNGPGSAAISFGTAVGTFSGDGIVTQGAPKTITVTSPGTVTITVSGTLNAFQLENGPAGTGTSFIPTGTSPVTRAADVVQVNGAPLTLQSANAGTVIIRAEATGATGNFATLYRDSAAVISRNTSDTSGFGANNLGGSTIYYALGSGGFRTGARIGLSWSASNRKLVGNGGSISSGSTLKARTTTGVHIGSNISNQFWNGYVSRLDLYSTQLADTTLRRLTELAPFDLAMWGDSLTARSDGPEAVKNTVPGYLGTLFTPARNVFNGGVEGDTSTQIRTRFLATYLGDKPTIIWAGRNDYLSGNVSGNVATIVGTLTTPRYLVLSILNNHNEGAGNANYNSLIAVNNALAATYGDRFLDIRALLVAAYNPADPLDTLNHANDIVPASMRLVTGSGTLASPIADATTQSFTLPFAPGTNNPIVKVGSEYIRVTASSGTTVTACVRGYAGSTAAAHAAGEAVEMRDTVHLSDPARLFVAQAIRDKVQALGW